MTFIRGKHTEKRVTRTAYSTCMIVTLALTAVFLQGGSCTSISINPTCPSELRVGQSGPVDANEENPGGIPIYRWQVIPAGAGTFDNAAAHQTTFQAIREGTAEIRLTAGDGLFQVISSCTIVISGAAPLAVALTASPVQSAVGDTVTLTCRSIGQTPATMLAIEQVEGPRIHLTPGAAGVVTLVPVIAGSPRFRCIGKTAAGEESDPSFVTLTVRAADGTDNDNDNQNTNANDNGNTNTNMNDNRGGGRR